MIETLSTSGSRGLARGISSRIAGLAGLGFALSVIVQNGLLASGAPMNDASVAEISSYYLNKGGGIAVAVGLVAVNMPLIFLFFSGFYTRLVDTPGRAWGLFGIMGGISLAATFGLTTLLQVVLAANAERLNDQPGLTQLLWDLHSGALVLTAITLGITLTGLSRAGLVGSLTPAWLAYLGLAGGALMIVVGVAAVAIVNGSPLFFLQFAGFAVWLFWLIITSVILIRERTS